MHAAGYYESLYLDQMLFCTCAYLFICSFPWCLYIYVSVLFMLLL